MKKYAVAVASFVAGALFMVSAQSFGATTSLIGKKIDGQVTVKSTEGKVIGQAIVVQGKSFAPVRDVTTAMGGEVKSATSGGIVLDTPDKIAEAQQDQINKETEIANVKQQIEIKNQDIAKTQSSMENIKKIMDEAQAKIDDYEAKGLNADRYKTQYSGYKAEYDRLNETLNNQQNELVKLQTQLTDLQK